MANARSEASSVNNRNLSLAGELTIKMIRWRRMVELLLILQALTGDVATLQRPPAPPAPTIEIAGQSRMDRLTIERSGTVEIKINAQPGTSDIEAQRNQPAGRRSYRDLNIDFRVAATIEEAESPVSQGARAPVNPPSKK